MLQELKFDESLLCFKNYKFLCLVELLRTDWKRMLRDLSFICPRFHDTCERHEQIKFDCSMTYATSIISTKIWLSSPTPWSYLDTILPLYDGYTTILRGLRVSRVAFIRQSGSFLFPSYCLRESKRKGKSEKRLHGTTQISRIPGYLESPDISDSRISWSLFKFPKVLDTDFLAV